MSRNSNPCAACEHWQVEAPPEWRPDHWENFHTARPHLYDWYMWNRNTAPTRVFSWETLQGSCHFEPKEIEKAAVDTCGKFNSWFTPNPEKQLDDYFLRKWSFYKTQNQKLKEQLKNSRRISRSRLKRLKELQ